MPSFRPGALFRELRRRRVFRVAAIYAIVGWVVVEVAATTFPHLGLPAWAVTLVIALTILGFPLALVAAWAYDVTPDGVVRTGPPGDAERGAEGRTGHDGGEGSSSDRPMADEPAPDEPQRHKDGVRDAGRARSIAVLPFADLSPDRDQEYFADGIAEELLNALAKVGGLRVPARTSCFAFKDRSLDIRQIGETLRVEHVLEGSVRKAGERLRITVQLIDIETGYHLWSEQYDRKMADVFAVQEKIARAVVDAVGLTLDERGRRAIETIPTRDIEAYDRYLQGRRFLHRFSRTGFNSARRMFEEAIGMDARFARAWAGLVSCHAYLYQYFDHDPAHLERAREASERVLSLAPGLAEARVARGHALLLTRRYTEAEEEFRRAISIDPDLYEAHYLYGRACWALGRLSEAARHFEQAHEVQPDEYQALCLASSVFGGLGDPDAESKTAQSAIRAIERHLKLYPEDARAYYLGAGCWIALGRRDRALEWGERSLALDPEDPAVAYNVGCVLARIGQHDRAMDELKRAWSTGNTPREWVENDPDLASLHGHPRFMTLLEKLE